MALTKISTGMLKQDAASSDLNIDAGTLYLDVSNNRVGIANTSPYRTLTVSGDQTIEGLLEVTAATPQILFSVPSGGLDSRIHNDGSGNFIFGTGTNSTTPTERMRITSAGNVGIGTTSPNLHGWTKAVTLDTTTNAGYELSQSGTKYGAFALQGDGRVQLTNFTANPLTFQTNNIERMRIDSSGNVGIGTGSTDNKVNIQESALSGRGASNSNTSLTIEHATDTGIQFFSATQTQIRFGDAASTGAGSIIYDHTTDKLRLNFGQQITLEDDGTTRLLIDSSGNAVIGGTTAKTRLQSSGAGSANAPSLGSASSNAPLYLTNSDTAYGLVAGTNSADGHVWLQAQRTDGTATAYNITLNEAGGNVGIRTTNPAFGLSVESDNGSGYAALFRKSSSDPALTIQTTGGVTQIQGLNSSLSATHGIAMQVSGGNVGIGTASPSYPLTLHNTGDGIKFEISDLVDANYRIQVSGNDIITGPSTSSDYLFQTGNTERMRIDSSGNVGIGETNPATLLHAKTASVEVARIESTSTSGSYLTFRDADTAAGNKAWIGADGNLLKFFSNNSTLNMTMTTGGNVGIGTSSPSSTLDVVGEATFGSGSYGVKLSYSNSATAGVIDTADSADKLSIRTGGTERMRIDSFGNVGIGVSPENSSGTWRNLQFGGGNLAFRNSGANDAMVGTGYLFKTDNSEVYKNTAGVSRLFFDNSTMIFQQAGSGTAGTAISWSEPMRIDSSGNLLVGKTSIGLATVGTQIEPAGGVYSTVASERAFIGNRTTTDGSIIELRKDNATVGSIGTAGGDLVIGSKASGHKGVRFGSNYIAPINTSDAFEDNTTDLGLPAVRFKDLYLSGGVNLVADSAASAEIQLKQTGTGGRDYRISSTGSGYGDAGALIFYDATASNERARLDSSGRMQVGKTSTSYTTTGVQLGTYNSNSVNDATQFCYTVSGGNNIYCTAPTSGAQISFYRQDTGGYMGQIVNGASNTVVYATSSDQRLKENIQDADDAGELIDSIQVRKFDWKADGQHERYGMVAQELNTVAPEAVTIPEIEDQYAGVDYSKLVPMLVKEIQSLRARVAQLEQ